MNWGYKILVVYLVFVAGILFMVFKSSEEKTDLVTTDYYAKELKYQEKIDQVVRTNALSDSLQYQVKDNQLQLSFPADFKGKKISGNITLYCPSDEDKDVKHDFEVQDGPVKLTIPAGEKGLFELQVNWLSDGASYYYEKKIII